MKSLLDLRNRVKEEVETGDEMKLWLRGVKETARVLNLEEVFPCSPGMMGAPSSIVPSLRTFKLEDLLKLSTICNQDDSLRSLEQLEVFGCTGLRKLPLTKQNAHTIKEIKG
ncbi:hypothetical protein Ddye_027249 [Dipteronia dyeriana]|uniref:Uncharacterized protein n=1 Tax=Dipteronia dyeriana TaxID=168575 RepID=A0AAD9TPN3_9ROSI|nr:hypothetical protein Ddye_027249 [Dipteronia dyeriana]